MCVVVRLISQHFVYSRGRLSPLDSVFCIMVPKLLKDTSQFKHVVSVIYCILMSNDSNSIQIRVVLVRILNSGICMDICYTGM